MRRFGERFFFISTCKAKLKTKQKIQCAFYLAMIIWSWPYSLKSDFIIVRLILIYILLYFIIKLIFYSILDSEKNLLTPKKCFVLHIENLTSNRSASDIKLLKNVINIEFYDSRLLKVRKLFSNIVLMLHSIMLAHNEDSTSEMKDISSTVSTSTMIKTVDFEHFPPYFHRGSVSIQICVLFC